VVIAMVIAGVLVGVKFHLDNTNDIVTVGLTVDTCMQSNFLQNAYFWAVCTLATGGRIFCWRFWRSPQNFAT